MIYPIRHFSFNVYNINRVVLILKQLGFKKIYDKFEFVEGWKEHIIKMESLEDNNTIELIESGYGSLDSNHICFECDVPKFMKKNKKIYNVIEHKGNLDKNREVYFVHIDDYIYFEFSKEINN